MGEYHAFLTDLIARVEDQAADGRTLGSLWDLEGDPNGTVLAELWAYVAEGVAAYTELTAGEAYLGTAADWSDLDRIAALVGYRPRPRVAAQGWARVEVERGADPVVPAGTRLQAPGTAERDAQTFEVVADSPLRTEWQALGATWVPEAAVPHGREVRFLGAPGFRAGDRVLFVQETNPNEPLGPLPWIVVWNWILQLTLAIPPAAATPLAVATVVDSTSDLGTTLVRFDRDLDAILTSTTAPYAAYRILATAGAARSLTKVLRIPATGTTVDTLTITAGSPIPTDRTSLVLDAPLEDLSAGQSVAIVDWQPGTGGTGRCDVVTLKGHVPVDWEVAPGTTTRVSRLDFAQPVGALSGTGARTAYILDRRIVARHYVFPQQRPGSSMQLRLYPRPVLVPPRVAVGVPTGETVDWQVFSCSEADEQEAADPGAPSGLIVDLQDAVPEGLTGRADATGNLLAVRHGTATSTVMGSGDAAKPSQRFAPRDAPIAYDLDAAGTPVSSLQVRVGGVAWREEPSLVLAESADQVFTTRLRDDGGRVVTFGDGVRGARLPTGRGNVTATYRVGGGTVGEVPSGAIDTLLGSVRGVKAVAGAGPTSGGADQDDEHDLRRLAPTRARAFDRVVSVEDIVDLSLGYPGVSHAAAWSGPGPTGCACGGASGLHVAFLRTGTAGPRAPLGAEIGQLAAFLDARRDTSVPLCVCAGAVTALRVVADLRTDPRRDAVTVVAAALGSLTAPDGPLAAGLRTMGQPLDRSDLQLVLHAVDGVLGVASMALPGSGELGRRAAARAELLVVDPASTLTGSAA